MLTLAMDTSTQEGSVALGLDGTILGELSLSVRATHSETVLPAIDQLLGEAGRTARDLEAVVVGGGPGSFTGVRIAAALARGICFPTGATLFAYSSLAAIAVHAAHTGDINSSGPMCALLDARRDQVYAAGYGGFPEFEELIAPFAASIDEVLGGLDLKAWTFAGVLSESQRERIRKSGARLLPAGRGMPMASALLHLTWTCPEAGRIAEPSRWEPTYVRSSSAERRLGDV